MNTCKFQSAQHLLLRVGWQYAITRAILREHLELQRVGKRAERYQRTP